MTMPSRTLPQELGEGWHRLCGTIGQQSDEEGSTFAYRR